MKTFLSVDWDYFIDAPSEKRDWLFPDGGAENASPEVKALVWSSRYKAYPDLKRLGTKKDEVKIIGELFEKYRGNVLIAESHKHIYKWLLARTSPEEAFSLWNIDFHSDMYQLQKGTITCGNWGIHLARRRPKMSYKWFGCEDSKKEQVPCSRLLSDFSKSDVNAFDGIFLCRSDLWSPPHLDWAFQEMATALSAGSDTWTIGDIMSMREQYKEA